MANENPSTEKCPHCNGRGKVNGCAWCNDTGTHQDPCGAPSCRKTQTLQDVAANITPLHARQPRSFQTLAKEALSVQDACNLSGVAQGFARAMLDLRELGLGTDACNYHPITILWLDKLTSLAGIQDLGNAIVMDAYNAAERLAKGEVL